MQICQAPYLYHMCLPVGLIYLRKKGEERRGERVEGRGEGLRNTKESAENSESDCVESDPGFPLHGHRTLGKISQPGCV